MVEYWCRTAKI